MLLLLATAAALLPPPADTLTYRFTLSSRQEVDASTIGQGTDRTGIDAEGRFRVVVGDSAGVQRVTVLLDSVAFRSPNPRVSVAALQPAPGTRFSLRVINGEVVGPVTIMPRTLGATQLAGLVELLYPTRVTGRAEGVAWTDSTVADTATTAGQEVGATRTEWRVVARDGATLTLEGALVSRTRAVLGQGELATETAGIRRVTVVAREPVLTGRSEERMAQEVRGSEGVRMRGQGTRILEIVRLP